MKIPFVKPKPSIKSARHQINIGKVKGGIAAQHSVLKQNASSFKDGQTRVLAHHGGGIKAAPFQYDKAEGVSSLSINHTHAAIGATGAGGYAAGSHRSENKHPSIRGYNHPVYTPYKGTMQEVKRY